ncbi:hypothetical protein N665_0152s0026 [Sinapis alba]|nr:hypothetical protein N665_0152s0026 [Sinapis alba]
MKKKIIMSGRLREKHLKILLSVLSIIIFECRELLYLGFLRSGIREESLVTVSWLGYLCPTAFESRNHLFFECSYTWEIWRTVASRCGLNPARSWNLVLIQLESHNRRSTRGILNLFCWQGCIYWSWSERNARLHRNVFRSYDMICRLLDRQMRDKILSFRASTPSASSIMMQQWLA